MNYTDQSEDTYRKILITYIGDYLCPPDDERYPASSERLSEILRAVDGEGNWQDTWGSPNGISITTRIKPMGQEEEALFQVAVSSRVFSIATRAVKSLEKAVAIGLMFELLMYEMEYIIYNPDWKQTIFQETENGRSRNRHHGNAHSMSMCTYISDYLWAPDANYPFEPYRYDMIKRAIDTEGIWQYGWEYGMGSETATYIERLGQDDAGIFKITISYEAEMMVVVGEVNSLEKVVAVELLLDAFMSTLVLNASNYIWEDDEWPWYDVGQLEGASSNTSTIISTDDSINVGGKKLTSVPAQLSPKKLAEWICTHEGALDLYRANLYIVDNLFYANPPIDLKGVTLSGSDLRWANLGETDLREANLQDANLEGANLQHANMEKANFSRANIKWANLSGVKANDADLQDSNLAYAGLSYAKLTRANLTRADMHGAALDGANLHDANLQNANLANIYSEHLNVREDLEGMPPPVVTNTNLTRADLRNAIFCSSNLASANFSYADLRNAIFDSSNLASANFSYADLRNVWMTKTNRDGVESLGVISSKELTSVPTDLSSTELARWISEHEGALNLYRANLDNVDLKGIDLVGSYLIGASATGANLSGTNLSGANLSGANLAWANFRGANLSGANLKGANLSYVNLAWVHLRGINLDGAKLSDTNLEGTDLKEAHLDYADLSGAYIWSGKLQNTTMQHANLCRANLFFADLDSANLCNANLEGANMEYAKPPRANLSGANLKGANLAGTDLRRTNLEGADLTGVDLTGTIGIGQGHWPARQRDDN